MHEWCAENCKGDLVTFLGRRALYLTLQFLLFTGCRKMEAQTLYVSDIHDDWAVIKEHKTDYLGMSREIHLVPAAQRVLVEAVQNRQAMRHLGPLVFPGQTGGEISAIDDYLTTG